jgi:hypothetical protein
VIGVFRKTALGVRELQTHELGLRPELRRLLIMIDGKRAVEALAPLFRANELSTLIYELVAHGAIELVQSLRDVAKAPLALSEQEHSLLTGRQFRAAVQAASASASELLGRHAKPWVKKIDSCSDSKSLRVVVSAVQEELRRVLGDDAAEIYVASVRDAAGRADSI